MGLIRRIREIDLFSFVLGIISAIGVALLGFLASAAVEIWSASFMAPRLTGSMAIYSETTSSGVRDGTAYVHKRYYDVAHRCGLAQLRMRVPGATTDADSSTKVVVKILLSNDGRTEANNIAVTLSLGESLRIDEVRAEPPRSVTGTEAQSFDSQYILHRYRLGSLGPKSEVVLTLSTFLSEEELETKTKFTLGTTTFPLVEADQVDSYEIREVVPARELIERRLGLPSLGLKTTVKGRMDYPVAGDYVYRFEVIEWSGYQPLSFDGTCGYEGPERNEPIWDSVQAYVDTVTILSRDSTLR